MRLSVIVTGGRRSWRCLAPLLVAGFVAAAGVSVAAQNAPVSPEAPQQDPASTEAAIAAALAEQPDAQAGPPAMFTYANRPIALLRGSFVGRAPSERVSTARLVLDRIVKEGITSPVETREIGRLITIGVGGRYVFTIMPADVDTLTGETQASLAALAASRLQAALNEVAELRRPRQLLVAGVQVLIATAAFVGMLWLLLRARRITRARMGHSAERRLRASGVADHELLRSSRIVEILQGLVTFLAFALAVAVGYFWLTFALGRFPYTRPWGESLAEFLLTRLSVIGSATLAALPGLFTVLVIVVVTRFIARVAHLLFQAVEGQRVAIPGLYAETAQPTRKLLTALLWLFAIALAYPYLPGSDLDAFKGVSVFIGLMISLGSSGLVNQVMSGLTLTYSRALRTGDYVAVGTVEGTVSQVGMLSTKIRTIEGEDVTIPNALVVSQTVTNYSRFAEADGVYVPTSITIGYDTPWRQVEALLLLAARRTPGVRQTPAPRVFQSALEDFYVKYTLEFCIDRPVDRRHTMAAVHVQILDAFNEYGVQIMSPRYVMDPPTAKLVPSDQWFAPPAEQSTEPAASAAPWAGPATTVR